MSVLPKPHHQFPTIPLTMTKFPKSLSVFLNSRHFIPCPLLILSVFVKFASGFGSMGPISAAFGENGFFCAIDASGKQEVICWGKNSSSLSSNPAVYSTNVPSMAVLAGGGGFLCGILSNTSQAYCWDSVNIGTSYDLVPQIFQRNSYKHISAGKDHVCAVRGSYYSNNNLGTVDCWDIVQDSHNNSLRSQQSTRFYNQEINNLVFQEVVSGDGFSCGSIREGGIKCWGPNVPYLGRLNVSQHFTSLASGVDTVCGVLEETGEIKCWGNTDSLLNPPIGVGFVSLAAGLRHFCGIRRDNHGIQCWGSFNSSSIPKVSGSGFFAIASSDFIMCGIREDDLVLDCWFANVSSPSDYDPPLQLCSPGLCTPGSCGADEFAFNASLLHEQHLTSLCVRKDLQICFPCGTNCSEGFFLSSPCSERADRVCTSCSLCQNSSCSDVCKLPNEMQHIHQNHYYRLVLIVVSCASGIILILLGWCILPRLIGGSDKDGKRKKFGFCIGKIEKEADGIDDMHPPLSVAPCPGLAQVFRLSELKDATNGFKEFNELGRGSYGFVYKAVLSDGRQVAVKRANAATIIHTNSREFEMELELLCSVRHSNIVNLLGYCSEMGERLLVYELMPHGTLHDHLHGGLSPLNWSLRLKIAFQAAKGLEYLHKEFSPPIIHQNVSSSNILLDSDWGARISDFGLLSSNELDTSKDVGTDVYDFGIVLLEILSGRKANDRDSPTPRIVDWAVPIIRQGKAAAVIDRYVDLPRNVEPLLKLADLAELAVSENPDERPTMSELALSLEQLVKDGFTL